MNEYVVFLLLFLFLLLIMFDELLLHQEVVLYPFELELSEPALGDRSHWVNIDVPVGSLEIASIPLFFFFLPTLGGGGIGFFLA